MIKELRHYMSRIKRVWISDKVRHVKNPGGKKSLGKYLVYQNREAVPGLMTHVARVLCFSDYAERNGYYLVVDMKSFYNMNMEKDRVGLDNTWEYYYEQPFGKEPTLDAVLASDSYWFTPEYRKFLFTIGKMGQDFMKSRLAMFLLNLKHTDFIDSSVPKCLAHPEVYERCCEVYQKYIRYNQATKEYTDREFDKLLKGKRAVGVSIRGTDYSVSKIFGHPIQPEIQDVIEKTREYMNDYGYEYIYLSCEEYAAVERFEEAFPGKVIINDRKFFDNIDFKTSKTGIWAYGFDRENDAMLRGLEYLSSMNLLSKCDALIAGINTGSQMAYIMNNNQYEHVYFYNLGKYGIDDC